MNRSVGCFYCLADSYSEVEQWQKAARFGVLMARGEC